MPFKSKASRVTLFTFTGLFLILSVVLIVLLCIFDRLYLSILFRHLALSPSSPIYPDWIKPSVPIYFSVHLFNVTNPEVILKGGRPILQEIGPFVYLESRERFDVTFSNESRPTRVRFKHRIFYHFVKELSIADPTSLTVIIPDFLYFSLMAWTSTHLPESPFVKVTAEEAMWGYSRRDVPILLSALLFFAPEAGLFSTINGTNVNEFLMNTGAENIYDIGQLYEVDGVTKLSAWDHEEANMINGTDGSLAPPGLDVGSTITFHVPDICRSSTLYAVGKTTAINDKDVQVTVFSSKPPDETDPLAKWRGNMFCLNSNGCPPKGLIYLGPCLKARNVHLEFYLSQPYFLDGDPSLREPFDGLPEANYRDHSTWLHIEPTTGFVLEAFKRIQFNVHIVNLTSKAGEMKGPFYFPIGWVAETAVADANALSMIRNKVLVPRATVPVIITIAIVFSIFAFIVCFLLVIFCARTRKRRSTVCPSEDVSPLDKTPVKLMQCDGDGVQASEGSRLLGYAGSTDASSTPIV